MASLSYEDIFSDFLGSVTDYQIANMDISDAYALMTEQLHKTLSQSYIRRLFSSVSLDDEVQMLSYEMTFETDEDADKDFVRYVLSKGMVVEWINPQVKSKINLSQFFGGKEQTFFSQSNHIAQLREMLEDTKRELRKLIQDRGYINNTYLGKS